MSVRRKVIYKPRNADIIRPMSMLWASHLGIWMNLKYLLLELLFSKQVVKVILDTASMPLDKPDDNVDSRSRANATSWRGDNGLIAELTAFLPATIFVHYLERPLTEMLFEKYIGAYDFLIAGRASASNHETILEDENSIGYNISEVSYRLNKSKLPEVSSYLSKLEAIWLVLECIVASATYIWTNSIELVILFTGAMEVLKRFRI